MTRYIQILSVLILTFIVGYAELLADDLVLLTTPLVTTMRTNSIGSTDVDTVALADSALSAAHRLLRTAGYRVLVASDNESPQTDTGRTGSATGTTLKPDLVLIVSITIARDFMEPCLPGDEKQGCLAGVDPRRAGGIRDPKTRTFLSVDPVIADKLEIECFLFESFPRTSSEDHGPRAIWSNKADTVPMDDGGPILVSQTHIVRLIEKALASLPKAGE